MRLRITAISLFFLAACAASPLVTQIAQSDAGALLLGEQHDAPEHQRLHRDVVDALAARGVLAALALEMAQQGASTAGLAPQASEEQVRSALKWNEGWPWAAYGPAVMAAVRAGVPVVGANLPSEQMRAAMADRSLEDFLPGPLLQAQQESIRLGHCELLPPSQLAPMTRVQIARDRAMAQTLVQLQQPGKTVLLIAGAGHVDPELGVPRYLPAGLERKAVVLPEPIGPRKDYCEDMRRSLAAKPAS